MCVVDVVLEFLQPFKHFVSVKVKFSHGILNRFFRLFEFLKKIFFAHGGLRDVVFIYYIIIYFLFIMCLCPTLCPGLCDRWGPNGKTCVIELLTEPLLIFVIIHYGYDGHVGVFCEFYHSMLLKSVKGIPHCRAACVPQSTQTAHACHQLPALQPDLLVIEAHHFLLPCDTE